MNYRPDIDGLRAISVVLVILFHADVPFAQGGFVGVDVFFVISGYLITGTILQESRAGRFTLVDFYERRARRILPALLAVVIWCVPVALLIMLPRELADFGESLIGVSTFSSNVAFWLQSNYFSQTAGLKPLLHTWSLSVEEQFYIFFPAALLVLLRTGGERLAATSLGLATLASFLLTIWAASRSPVASFFLAPTRAWELLAGALAVGYTLTRSEAVVTPQSRLAQLTPAVALSALLASAVLFDAKTPHPGWPTIIPVLATVVLLLDGGRSTLNKALAMPVLVIIGLSSYSSYLWHHVLFAFTRLLHVSPPSSTTLVLLGAVSLGIGWLSWRYIERPFRDRRWLTRRQVFVLSGVGLFACLACGLLLARDGLRFRFEPDVLAIAEIRSGDSTHCRDTLSVEQIRSGDRCIVGSPGATPTVALIGDSHAAELTDALAELMNERGTAAEMFTGVVCVPLHGYGTRHAAKKPECRAFASAAIDAVAGDPSIERVILFAEWPYYTKGARRGDRVRSAYDDGSTRNDDPARNGEFFARALSLTLRKLVDAGKEVWLVGSVPEYDVHLPTALARQFMLGVGRELPEERRVSLAAFNERNEEVIAAFDLVEDVPGVHVYQPSSILCSTRHCIYVNERSELLYRDSNHLSIVGSRLLIEDMARTTGF